MCRGAEQLTRDVRCRGEWNIRNAFQGPRQNRVFYGVRYMYGYSVRHTPYSVLAVRYPGTCGRQAPDARRHSARAPERQSAERPRRLTLAPTAVLCSLFCATIWNFPFPRSGNRETRVCWPAGKNEAKPIREPRNEEGRREGRRRVRVRRRRVGGGRWERKRRGNLHDADREGATCSVRYCVSLPVSSL